MVIHGQNFNDSGAFGLRARKKEKKKYKWSWTAQKNSRQSYNGHGCFDGSQVDSGLICHGRRRTTKRGMKNDEELIRCLSTSIDPCYIAYIHPPRNIAEIYQPNHVLLSAKWKKIPTNP